MTGQSNTSTRPQRGEIWLVNFNPAIGDEIYKRRPAVVMNIPSRWNLKLHIVVPVTKWQRRFKTNNYFWMVELPKDNSNNLTFDSAANAFQIKSVSHQRFNRKIGVVTAAQLDLIVETIAFCIGYFISENLSQSRNKGC